MDLAHAQTLAIDVEDDLILVGKIMKDSISLRILPH